MKVSRTMVICANIILLLGITPIIAAFFINIPATVQRISLINFVTGNILCLHSSKCPHCKRITLPFYKNPFSTRLGYCRHCGGLVEFE